MAVVSRQAGAVEAPGEVGPGEVEEVKRVAVGGVGEERGPVEEVGGAIHDNGLAVRAVEVKAKLVGPETEVGSAGRQ